MLRSSSSCSEHGESEKKTEEMPSLIDRLCIDVLCIWEFSALYSVSFIITSIWIAFDFLVLSKLEGLVTLGGAESLGNKSTRQAGFAGLFASTFGIPCYFAD
ncbi:unnamed protein product [Cuscuta epithymum]|uniref:Uncharacterized protein n=1 Tax=Cuscuta epithymum TaxID=186058 RepID=A0AAV0EIL6_9ASTE|nr:unnamed protein product [Cuscuta epithymum]